MLLINKVIQNTIIITKNVLLNFVIEKEKIRMTWMIIDVLNSLWKSDLAYNSFLWVDWCYGNNLAFYCQRNSITELNKYNLIFLCKFLPQVVYNSHYGNGAPAVFTSKYYRVPILSNAKK